METRFAATSGAELIWIAAMRMRPRVRDYPGV